MREPSSTKKGAKPNFLKQTRAKHFTKKAKGRHLKAETAKWSQFEKPRYAHEVTTNPSGSLESSKKRKRNPTMKNVGEKPAFFKHSKFSKSAPFNSTGKVKSSKALKFVKEAKSPKGLPITDKEKTESRKMKRKPNYNLEKELTLLWEKMRCYSIGKEERSKMIAEALQKMSGKLLDIVSSHVPARVLQTCIKYGSQEDRKFVFEELRPHLCNLSCKKYAVHLVKKLLDTASKEQLEGFISSLHGHASFLIRHTIGSAVLEHAYNLANGSQRRCLLMEMYSTELQLFKDLTLTNNGSLAEIILKFKLQKSLVVHHMTSIIQPLLEKGIVDYSIIHTILVEYFTVADRSSAADVIQQLLPLLVQKSAIDESNLQASEKKKNKRRKMRMPLMNMMNTRDGLRVGVLCIKHGTAKDRKKIVKGIKDCVGELALDQNGSLLLSCILSVVDDTKLVTKIIIRELQSMLNKLVLDKNGRRPLLQLLHPYCHRHFTPEDLACLSSIVPSLSTQDEREEKVSESVLKNVVENDKNVIISHSNESTVLSKKDVFLRRKELLVDSGLAECLVQTCIDKADELLRSNLGKEVIFEVAVGGFDGILQELDNRLTDLHKAIANIAARSKSEQSEGDHILENFHSSRTLRKLVLDCPTFAETLWKVSLEGKSEMWCQGHSGKVVSALIESSDPNLRDLVKSELQPLVDGAILKLFGRK